MCGVSVIKDHLSNRNVCAFGARHFREISVRIKWYENHTKQTPGHTSEQVLRVQLDAGTPGGIQQRNNQFESVVRV